MNEKRKTGNPEQPCVYILKCSDGSLYTGWTNNIAERVYTHNCGKGSKYTRSRLPVQLVYIERLHTKSDALRREAAIKQMSREQKLKLIADSAATNISPENVL